MRSLSFLTAMLVTIGIITGIALFLTIQQPVITISTDRKIYDNNHNGMEVSGIVKPMVEGRSLFFTVIEPNGTSYRPDTIGNFHDGRYDVAFSIGLPHWKEKGTYKIIANYGDMKVGTSVEFNPTIHP